LKGEDEDARFFLRRQCHVADDAVPAAACYWRRWLYRTKRKVRVLWFGTMLTVTTPSSTSLVLRLKGIPLVVDFRARVYLTAFFFMLISTPYVVAELNQLLRHCLVWGVKL
jgi:hypothetical protein